MEKVWKIEPTEGHGRAYVTRMYPYEVRVHQNGMVELFKHSILQTVHLQRDLYGFIEGNKEL